MSQQLLLGCWNQRETTTSFEDVHASEHFSLAATPDSFKSRKATASSLGRRPDQRRYAQPDLALAVQPMNVNRGLKRAWIVGAIIWAVFVPLRVAWEISEGVQGTYSLAWASADVKCRAMREAPSNCFSVEYDRNVAEYGNKVFSEVISPLSERWLWHAVGWFLALLAAIVLPPLIVLGTGAIVVWIGRGFGSGSG